MSAAREPDDVQTPALRSILAPDGRKKHAAPLFGVIGRFEHPREPSDRELAWLAGRQHWCLHRHQLAAGGVGYRGVAGRVDRRQLTPLFSDVFLWGRQDPDPLSAAMAVALHLRGDGLISHEYATWMWGLTEKKPEQVIVTLVGRQTRAMPNVALHRVAAIDRADVRWRNHIPITSPARAVIDFATQPGVSLPRVESAFATLRRQAWDADRQLRQALDRLPANHHGAPMIRKLLALPPGELVLTKSIYERRLRKLLKKAGIAMPDSNQQIAGFERDLVWRGAKLIVEFDGYIFHKDKFREDRARDAKAVAAGWRVMRITADRVDTEPLVVLAEIAAALAA